jgi:predicted enzyme related to lactoylglutathione lyase
MQSKRRHLLRIMSVACGSLLFGRNQFGVTEQAANPGAAGDADMEKVTGIGGLFFRAHDPKALGQWYKQNLGIELTPTSYGASVWRQEAGPTAFTPFPETTGYFGDPNKTWMVNFRVRNLDKMAAQLRSAGITVEVDPKVYHNGRFAHLRDPENNPIELWQPSA